MREKFEIAENEADALRQIDRDMIKLNNEINHLSRLYNGQKLQKINLLRQMVTNAGMTGDYQHDERYDFMHPLADDEEPKPLKIVSTEERTKTRKKARTKKMAK